MADFRFFVSHPKRRTKPLAMLAAAAVAMLACVPSAQAADTTPLDPNPGPA